MTDFQIKCQKYRGIFDEALGRYLKQLAKTSYAGLYNAMQYSLLAGGKRVRPLLALGSAECLGVNLDFVTPFAVAVEMIHTYSLIHDDLPCMDNDDYRRGKPTNHKIFGEGNAVLAGDALLNLAYEICIDECAKGKQYADAAKILAVNAGASGMISGQAADLFGENIEFADGNLLEYIHLNKTAKLITAAVTLPTAFTSGEYTADLKKFGEKLGVLFQYTDDIMDVKSDVQTMGKSAGKDKDENKMTIVRLLGLAKAEKAAENIHCECTAAIEKHGGKFEFLRLFADGLKGRNS